MVLDIFMDNVKAGKEHLRDSIYNLKEDLEEIFITYNSFRNMQIIVEDIAGKEAPYKLGGSKLLKELDNLIIGEGNNLIDRLNIVNEDFFNLDNNLDYLIKEIEEE